MRQLDEIAAGGLTHSEVADRIRDIRAHCEQHGLALKPDDVRGEITFIRYIAEGAMQRGRSPEEAVREADDVTRDIGRMDRVSREIALRGIQAPGEAIALFHEEIWRQIADPALRIAMENYLLGYQTRGKEALDRLGKFI
jgi:hypothetical protein